MRILVVPYLPNAYELRMVDGIVNAFRHLGHEAMGLRGPLLEHGAELICRAASVDVLFQINSARPASLPRHIRHVSWFQDPVMPADLEARTRDSDVVYTITGASDLDIGLSHCRTGYLQTGVDENILAHPSALGTQEVDFSLCAYIPLPSEPAPPPPHVLTRKREIDLQIRKWALGRVGGSLLLRRGLDILIPPDVPPPGIPTELFFAMRGIVDSVYRPLRGELDMAAITTLLHQAAEPFGAIVDSPEFKALAVDMAREYPRLIDRALLVTTMLEVSDSIELYGHYWDRHPEFHAYHRGMLYTQRHLLQVFRRSRINLANSTHGLGLHSRTLECMAVGGFIFTHESGTDDLPGGIRTSFEPGVHYGVFTPENMRFEAIRWLNDSRARMNVGEQARSIIMEKHLWRHRAQQILSDLT